MKSKLAALLLASATLGAGPAIFAPPTSAQAQVEVSFDFFYDTLSPYGEWIEVGDYGLCWRPSDVDANWAPYTDGYWTYTDAGWTWVSYEEFGAVAYHYGRWVAVEDEGWCWVPDYEWGPAWVSWRNSDDYIGWAPLPPEARWEPDRGFSVWVDTSYDIGPSYYNFCAVEDFGAPVIREVIIERPRNFFIIGSTFNITNISINRSIGVPFCGGPRFDFIRGRSRRPIPTLKLVRETNITNIEKNVYINKTVNKTVINNNGGGGRGGLRAAVQGNQLIVPAPKVKRADRNQIVEKVKPKRRVAATRVNRGWKGVRDENQRREIRDKFAKQTEGRRPENAPAKPVDVAELKPVPVKADPNAPSPVSGRNRDRDRDRGDRPGRGAEQAAEKPSRGGRPGSPDRPSRPAAEDKKPAPTPGGGRDLKPFNERREDRGEAKKKEGKPEAVRPPAPMVPQPRDDSRGGDRKRPDRDERQVEENRRRKQQEDAEALQRSRQQRQREEQQLQERMRQRQSEPPKADREGAAARQREAAQQEMRQQQRRQEQAREAEAAQRKQQQRAQENRQQQTQAIQRQQQAAREQQQQQMRRQQQQQQRQAQPERQIQREVPKPQREAKPERQAPKPQMQARPQQERRMQQQPRPGGGGGGRGEGGGRGDGGGRNRGERQEEGRGRR